MSVNKRRLYWFGAAICVFGVQNALAQVPHSFVPGTPARASEVNENFRSLDGALAAVETRVSTLEQESSIEPRIDFFSTSQVNLPVGTPVTVGGTTYTIVQFEFIRHDTGEVYLVRFPDAAPVFGGTGTSNTVSFSVTGLYAGQTYTGPSTLAQVLTGGASPLLGTTLNGFSAYLSERNLFSVSAFHQSADQQIIYQQSVRLSVDVLVGTRTRFTLSFEIPESPEPVQIRRSTASPDFSGLVPVGEVMGNEASWSTQRQLLRELLRYVWLESKP